MHPQSNQSVGCRLGHRPAEKRHYGLEARRIAFGDDTPIIHDDQSTRAVVRLLWINPGEGGLDPCFKRGAVNAGRYCFKVDALALRPKCLWVGRWHGRGQTRRLRAQSFFCPAVNKRAAEALAENSCLRSDEAGKRRLFSEEAIGGRDAFGVPIDNRFEVLERLVGRTTQVSGQNVLRGALRDENTGAGRRLRRNTLGLSRAMPIFGRGRS